MSAIATSRSHVRWGLTLIVLGLGLALIVYTCAFMLATYQGLDYKCTVDGPRSPLAEVTEAPVVTGEFIHWPLGRQCTAPRADGTGVVVTRSADWTGTILLVTSLSIALGGVVLTAVGTFAKR
jgi:hypothetical protein